MDIVTALRQLFDTFKPGGEGQATGLKNLPELDGQERQNVHDMVSSKR